MDELPLLSGYSYIRETAHLRKDIKNFKRPDVQRVEQYKRYPEAEQIALPRTWQLKEELLAPLLQQRRSLRRYSGEPILLEELAFMLWASQGITALAGKYSFRTAPSGGALYPVETYLSVHSVAGLSPGLYHFAVEQFSLERLSDTGCKEAVATACLDQKFIADSAVTFLWSAVFRRSMAKYGNRGMRYILLDAGHICQNVLLAADATGSGGCAVAAFYDDEVNTLLNISPNEESILYAAAVGKKE